MTWPLSNAREQRRIERALAKRGIPFDRPGFCDHTAFRAVEQKDPRFLETYARYVEQRAYDDGYLAAARSKIIATASAMEAAIRKDGRNGACVDASIMIGRMLDRLEVWNYLAKVTLTVHFPAESELTSRYFWALDKGRFAAPHAVVVAPPFGIVDVTVRHQGYSAEQLGHLPDMVLADQWSTVAWDADDIANSDIRAELEFRRMPFAQFMRHRHPHMLEVMAALPTREYNASGTKLKYVVVAASGIVEPLEGITGYKPSGRTALQIFEEDVVTQLSNGGSRS